MSSSPNLQGIFKLCEWWKVDNGLVHASDAILPAQVLEVYLRGSVSGEVQGGECLQCLCEEDDGSYEES